MMYTNFEGQNGLFKAPVDMKDRCGDLPVLITKDSFGDPIIVSAWMPSAEDLAAMNAGRAMYLKIVGKGMPPVSLFTLDENDELNP